MSIGVSGASSIPPRYETHKIFSTMCVLIEHVHLVKITSTYPQSDCTESEVIYYVILIAYVQVFSLIIYDNPSMISLLSRENDIKLIRVFYNFFHVYNYYATTTILIFQAMIYKCYGRSLLYFLHFHYSEIVHETIGHIRRTKINSIDHQFQP